MSWQFIIVVHSDSMNWLLMRHMCCHIFWHLLWLVTLVLMQVYWCLFWKKPPRNLTSDLKWLLTHYWYVLCKSLHACWHLVRHVHPTSNSNSSFYRFLTCVSIVSNTLSDMFCNTFFLTYSTGMQSLLSEVFYLIRHLVQHFLCSWHVFWHFDMPLETYSDT